MVFRSQLYPMIESEATSGSDVADLDYDDSYHGELHDVIQDLPFARHYTVAPIPRIRTLLYHSRRQQASGSSS